MSAKGTIEKVSVVQGVHPEIDREAIRVVKSMASWNPATVDDEPVASFYEMPITFNF